MKKIRFLGVVPVIFFLCAVLNAEGASKGGKGSGAPVRGAVSSGDASVESRASSVLTLDSVCQSLSSRPLMTGDFVQEKTILKAGRTLTSSGIFIFSEEGILWKTQKPFPSAMAVTLDAVIQTRADGKKTVTDAKGNQIFLSISKSLSAMFRGNKNELLDNFNVEFSTEGNAGQGWTIHLTPKDKTVQAILGSIEVSGAALQRGSSGAGAVKNAAGGVSGVVSSGSGAFETKIDSIYMKEMSGDTIRYTFQNHRFPESLTQDEKKYFSAE